MRGAGRAEVLYMNSLEKLRKEACGYLGEGCSRDGDQQLRKPRGGLECSRKSKEDCGALQSSLGKDRAVVLLWTIIQR